MLHLRSVDIRNHGGAEDFPFSVPVVRTWQPMTFEQPVTFFVGENGTGKSTVLEALAAAAGTITAGAEQPERDSNFAEIRRLAKTMRLTWNKRTRRGFFLRAEDFIGFVKKQSQIKVEMQAELRRVDEEYEGRSEYAKGLAKMPFTGQLKDMEDRYGEGLEKRSHGEQFLDFFQNRFVPGGLYLLDEPEAPLSPMRQLGFLALLKEMVAKEGQFIIATHAPILMAFPSADIYLFDDTPPRRVGYDELEHVNLTRDFLNQPDQFLRYL